ncbi:MAG: zinc ribbon domain-containing protein [Bacillota bacterium]|nr:FmdB family transcriptional regulator [Bacillota bacterium]REJ35220.1 MAG: FmdB family transcriptional regulator [Bacillota bacterium]
MPTYEYRCEKCGKFDYFQAITDAPLSTCPTCGQPVRRLISRNVNIIFKGPGFHITDYRKSGGAGGSSNGKDREREDSEASVANKDLD